MTTFDASEGLASIPMLGSTPGRTARTGSPHRVPFACSRTSALADGEHDEGRAAVAMLRVEGDAQAQAFLEDLERCAKLHRDFADPDR